LTPDMSAYVSVFGQDIPLMVEIRYITNIESIPPIPMRCLTVDSPSSLFLITKSFIPTHNSEALLLGALQYVDDYPTASLLLRRTYRDLDKAGGLMFRARQWLAPTNAHWDGINYRWNFPSGATLNFGYLEHEGDELKYQSSEYQYCVQADTLIFMGDGSWKKIRDIKISDIVATLIGPRPVKAVHKVGVKPVVNIETQHGSIVASTSHPILTESGWASPTELKSTRYCDACKSAESSTESYPTSLMRRVLRWLDQMRPWLRGVLHRLGIDYAVRHVSSTNDRNGSAKSDDEHPKTLQPQEWFGSAVLYEPAFHSTEQEATRLLQGANVYEKTLNGAPDSQPDYRPYCDSCDAPLPKSPAASPTHIPSQAGAGVLVSPSGSDATGKTQSHIQPEKYRYFHPYTNQPVEAREVVQHSQVRISPAGEAEVWDLEVAGASHYVSWGGIIAQNCGYDELTHFPEHQYLYLYSRLRRVEGMAVPLRLRAGTNPGGPGHHWVRKRWNLPDGTDPSTGRVFINANLYDNPFLKHDEYAEGLQQLGDVTKAQLLQGDWTATSTGGYFQAEKFRIVGWEELPHASEFVAIIRYWDFAATAPSELNPDPDYTVGLKIGMTATGSTDPTLSDFYVLDVERFRGDPGAVEARVRATALRDGPKVVQWLEQERGAAGKLNFRNYAVNVLQNSVARPLYAVGKKEDKAKVAAARVSEGRVFLVDGPWIGDFIPEMAVFPLGSHDDQVDGLSNGIIAIDRERIFASQGEVQKASQDYEIVRRRNQRTPRSHVGY